ncbi:MAG: peptide chain release factor N(5)-glutamine methyltransferase [Actinobacteria bacterium]|nr:peptide chain release factor N(5)-glutamine methyltransferase [Actinomycetota bacterium]
MQQKKQIWDIKKLLDWSVDYFEKKDIPQPRLSAELLLCAVLKFTRMQLYLNFNRIVKDEELSVFKGYILKRLEHAPIQYILNEAYFRNTKLFVDGNVLIPRPETELLVDKALMALKDAVLSTPQKEDKININILEIGTGSGAIAISIAQEIDEYLKRNIGGGISVQNITWKIIATECSSSALEIAKNNAEKILDRQKYENLDFINADIVPGNSQDFITAYKGKINILVSNPPYICVKDYAHLPDEVRLFEPEGALLAGDSGLEIYERILEMAFPFLREQNSCMLFETDPHTASGLKDLVKSYSSKNKFKSCDIVIEKDYNNRDRILSVKLKKS